MSTIEKPDPGAPTLAGEMRVPIHEEVALVGKRSVDREHVTVRTGVDLREVTVSEEVRREHVELTRIPFDREIFEMPPVRTDGAVTIVPVVEERLVVEKRLFLIEELHLTKIAATEPVELPATLRRTRVEIDREKLSSEEQCNG